PDEGREAPNAVTVRGQKERLAERRERLGGAVVAMPDDDAHRRAPVQARVAEAPVRDDADVGTPARLVRARGRPARGDLHVARVRLRTAREELAEEVADAEPRVGEHDRRPHGVCSVTSSPALAAARVSVPYFASRAGMEGCTRVTSTAARGERPSVVAVRGVTSTFTSPECGSGGSTFAAMDSPRRLITFATSELTRSAPIPAESRRIFAMRGITRSSVSGSRRSR